jgi:hypothetical protein
MRKLIGIIIYLASLVFISWLHAKGNLPATNPVINAKEFTELFTKEKVINLNVGNFVIGNINRMSIQPNGQFFLLDTRFGDFFFFDKSGNLIKKIDISKDLPGLKWSPIELGCSKNGNMLIYNAPFYLLRFNNSGDFEQKATLNQSYYLSHYFLDGDNNIIAYAVDFDKVMLVKLDPEGIEQQRSGEVPKEYVPYIRRVRVGGCVERDSEDNIYQTHIYSPQIFKYDSNLKPLITFTRKPSFFNGIAAGQTNSFSDAKNLMEMMEILNSTVQNSALFRLNDSLFISQYSIPKKGNALDIWSKSGNYYSSDQMVYKIPIIAASRNSVFILIQPDIDANGEIANPYIEQYRINYQ